MGGGGSACAEDFVTDSEVMLTTEVTDPHQILFMIGMNELRKGNYADAISIFESLSKRTESPRVRLELARALFLDRRFRAAEKVFQGVLALPDVPWTVQENIRAYLDEIKSFRGSVKFRFSLISDSNPRNFTESRTIRIAGQDLTLIPPEDNREVVGIRYSMNARRALTESGALLAYLNMSYSDYKNIKFDRWIADIGVLASFRNLPKFKLRAGLEDSFYAADHLYAFPYLAMIFIPQPTDHFRMNSELKFGFLDVSEADYMDAVNVTLTTGISRKISDKILVTGDISLEKSVAEEDAYSYDGGSIGLSLRFPLLSGWNLKPHVSVGQRKYAGIDPFFGDRRLDVRTPAGLTLQSESFQIMGFMPEIGFRYEENDSNLDYYSYEKIGFILNFN